MKKEILGERTPYLQRERSYGQGNVRVGRCLGVGDDIYSLGFISQISDDFLDKHFDVIKGELIEEEEEKDTTEPEPTQLSLNAEPTYISDDQRRMSIDDDPT